jgi:hypothetical protein
MRISITLTQRRIYWRQEWFARQTRVVRRRLHFTAPVDWGIQSLRDELLLTRLARAKLDQSVADDGQTTRSAAVSTNETEAAQTPGRALDITFATVAPAVRG